MSRFDIYQVHDGKEYVFDLQLNFLESYATRIAAPVVALAEFSNPAKGLNPIITIADEKYVILTHFLSAIPASELRHPIGNLSD